jgi:hypothetical protein
MKYLIENSASAIEPMVKCIRETQILPNKNKTRRMYMQFLEDGEIED